MDRETRNLDAMIEDALSDQDRRLLETTSELGYFALALGQFRGKLGWVTWVIMTVQAAMFLGAVWCAIAFYGATEMVPALKYGLTAAVLALMAVQLKLSLMPQMQADRVIREVRRVELLLAARGR